MRVAAVIPVDKRKCKVFLEEEDFAFILYRGEAEKFHIQEGDELSEALYRRIVEEILMPRARERALYLLQSQGRTRAQMEKKLSGDGYPQEVINRVMGFLGEYRFIDDSAYTENYIRVNQEKKSRRQMIFELQQKGVDRQDISRIMEENSQDDLAAARSLLKKRLRSADLSDPKERNRLGAYLGRRGFSYDVIRKVMEEVQSGAEEINT